MNKGPKRTSTKLRQPFALLHRVLTAATCLYLSFSKNPLLQETGGEVRESVYSTVKKEDARQTDLPLNHSDLQNNDFTRLAELQEACAAAGGGKGNPPEGITLKDLELARQWLRMVQELRKEYQDKITGPNESEQRFIDEALPKAEDLVRVLENVLNQYPTV